MKATLLQMMQFCTEKILSLTQTIRTNNKLTMSLHIKELYKNKIKFYMLTKTKIKK